MKKTKQTTATHKKQKKFSRLKKLLTDNADDIQKMATEHHLKLIGGKPLPPKKQSKYSQTHIKIIRAIARNLETFSRGVIVFRKLGVEIAKEALKDGLTMEEAVDGTIFQKQAIWKKLEETGALKEISTQDLYEFSQIIGNYCDVLATKIAFTYHNFFAEKISQTEARFRALTEKSSDAVALVTAKGKVTYASPATEGLMGYTPEEFMKLKNPFDLAPPDDRKFVTKLFEKLLAIPGSTEHAVYRVTHKNGTSIWIESDMTNLIEDPSVKAVVINYRDITERKQLETQKNDFIGIVTHELKTPLTSVKAYAQVLQSRFAKEGNVEAAEMLTKMDAQLKKLTGLIGDLLDVSKVDGGKLHYHGGLFDFNELVKEIVGEMRMTTLKHTITKHLATTKFMHGDRDRIGQVITNLISNAIKYSPHGKEIIVSTKEDDKNISLSVQDFGIGIPKDAQKKIFERFFRVGDSEDTFAGMGLGLFISSEIVKRHGGTMDVESNEGKGSTFSFIVPISRTATKNDIPNHIMEDERGTSEKKKKKILVIDDDPAILEAITLILEDNGYDVQTVDNGRTQKMAQEYLPDLILLDIWMSGRDGRVILKDLRAQKTTKHIPVIMISANKDTETIAKEYGADGFLSKPFDMKELQSKVATYAV